MRVTDRFLLLGGTEVRSQHPRPSLNILQVDLQQETKSSGEAWAICGSSDRFPHCWGNRAVLPTLAISC